MKTNAQKGIEDIACAIVGVRDMTPAEAVRQAARVCGVEDDIDVDVAVTRVAVRCGLAHNITMDDAIRSLSRATLEHVALRLVEILYLESDDDGDPQRWNAEKDWSPGSDFLDSISDMLPEPLQRRIQMLSVVADDEENADEDTPIPFTPTNR